MKAFSIFQIDTNGNPVWLAEKQGVVAAKQRAERALDAFGFGVFVVKAVGGKTEHRLNENNSGGWRKVA